mmetsp:Transcript_2117/g.4326  ORF Transcript_2117/g.4326 Transcript_2117/m.4326 type:complete len:249 (+) Transcript_2117:582-1328(+)
MPFALWYDSRRGASTAAATSSANGSACATKPFPKASFSKMVFAQSTTAVKCCLCLWLDHLSVLQKILPSMRLDRAGRLALAVLGLRFFATNSPSGPSSHAARFCGPPEPLLCRTRRSTSSNLVPPLVRSFSPHSLLRSSTVIPSAPMTKENPPNPPRFDSDPYDAVVSDSRRRPICSFLLPVFLRRAASRSSFSCDWFRRSNQFSLGIFFGCAFLNPRRPPKPKPPNRNMNERGWLQMVVMIQVDLRS